jgi:hypothetical protein
VTRTAPETGCDDVAFREGYSVDEAGELALEDYARTVGGARAAELVRTEGEANAISGVHLCGVGAPLTPALRADIEDFARALAAGGAAGLGWS